LHNATRTVSQNAKWMTTFS